MSRCDAKLGSRIRILLLPIALTTSAAFATDEPNPGQLPLEELRTFTDVFEHIRRSYVEEVDDKTLLENAIRGMLTGLDPHSAYLDADSFGDLQASTNGEFGGLGLEVGMENGFVRVISPIDDTPAKKAGIESGDLIIKLDDKPVKGMSLNEAVNHMRGPQGSDITLTIVRDGGNRPMQVVVTRDLIKVLSVRSRTLEPGYGYLRIAQFQAQTGLETVEALTDMQVNGHLKGLVLDLRNNPGGVLQSSVDVVDALLDAGMIVYTEGRMDNSRTEFHARPGDMIGGTPVVILINRGSASASEIVAGALQDHNRAIIMGTDSFGKGSVQTVMPISEERAIKLTTALYFTPNGRSIQAKGIEPDILVERAKVEKLEPGTGITEADLNGHLENASGEKSNGTTARKNKSNSDLQMRDNQLYEALSLLKGLNILSRNNTATASEFATATP